MERKAILRSCLALVAVASLGASLAPSSALAAGDASPRAESEVSSSARAHFDAGVNLLLDPEGARYEDAYREFQVAYAASKSPRILGNLGFCAMKLERDGEAIDAYTRYLEEAPDVDIVEREQIRRDLVTLRSGLVRVTIAVTPANASVLDVRHPVRGVPVSNVYVAEGGRVVIGVRPGRHVLKARDGALESAPWELEAAPGSRFEHRLTVAPPAQASTTRGSQGPKLAPLLVTGVGLAALAGGAVTGVFALKAKDNMDQSCPKGECPASFDLDGQTASTRRLVTMTDALLIGGGVLTAAGVTWLILSSGGSEKEKRATATSKPSSAPSSSPQLACSPLGCSVGYSGVF